MTDKTYVDEIEFVLPDNQDLKTEMAVYLRDNRGGKKFKIIGTTLYIARIFLWVLAGALSLKAFQHAHTYHQLAKAFEGLGYETNISHSLYVVMGTIAFVSAIPLLSKFGMGYWEKLHLTTYSQDSFLRDKDGYFYANKHHFKIFYKIPNGEYSSTISWSMIKSVENIENKCIILLLDNYTNFFYIPKETFKEKSEFDKVFEQLYHWQQQSRVSA